MTLLEKITVAMLVSVVVGLLVGAIIHAGSGE